MAKKKSSKKKELVILIRIPDSDSRDGKATLTIQRGELGHMSEFDYKGLTLKGNIAEAVGTALVKLVGVENAPPPEISTENAQSVSTPTDSSEGDEDTQSVSSDTDSLSLDEANEDENPPDSPEIDEKSPENAENPGVSTQTAIYDTDDTLDEEQAEKVSVSVTAAPTDTSDETATDKQQMSLF
jgi:hypothetical protein